MTQPAEEETPRSRPWAPWLNAFSDGPGMLREVVMIAIGVLIGFSADRVREDIATASRTRTIEEGLQQEVRASLSHAVEIRSLAACRETRLDQLATALGNGDATPDIERFGLAARPWRSAAWRSALASGVGEDMQRQRLGAYSVVYAAIDAASARQFTMRDRLIAARAGLFPGVTASDRAAALAAVEQVRADLTVADLMAEQLIEVARTDLAITPSPRAVETFAEAARRCAAAMAERKS